ncbi:MAG: YpdA family putative bacillithiol disulfide reductase [Gemmatimonadetes bacterium]|nr:YpdA family putative bacillithiol disulfide reductase [Gemmatimonadota bacterium]
MSAAPALHELAVVGAGPCGLGVGIAARRAGLSCVLIDKECVAGSIGRYPTWLTFFSTAERLEIGGVPFTIAGEKPTRREALRYYQRLAREFRLDVRQYHEVTAIQGSQGDFRIDMSTRGGGPRELRARNVVIATGYFDRPNRLGAPGDELAKVSYGYREAYPCFQQDCIVVGGGNSAVDAALELHRWNARVTLVHFEAGLDAGVKPWVLPDITARLRAGEIAARFRTRVAEIRDDAVVLRNEDTGALDTLANDWVLAMTGYTPDPVLLRQLRVRFDERTGIPEHDPETMLTSSPGVFIAGVIAAGNNANKVFIENGRDHGERITDALKRTRPMHTLEPDTHRQTR